MTKAEIVTQHALPMRFQVGQIVKMRAETIAGDWQIVGLIGKRVWIWQAGECLQLDSEEIMFIREREERELL